MKPKIYRVVQPILDGSKPPDNHLAIFKSDWKHFPSPAISLLEIMRMINVFNLSLTESLLADIIRETDKPPGVFLIKREVLNLKKESEQLLNPNWDEMGWVRTWERMVTLVGMLETNVSKFPLTAESVHIAAKEARMALYEELMERKFAMIDSQKTSYLNQEELFGKKVRKAFRAAAADIRDAGNCLALELHTAAVFHLMRVVEFGLRGLAKDLGVKISKKPLELAGWDEVINAIDHKISKRFNRKAPLALPIPHAKPKKRSYEKKELDKEFYRGAIHSFYGFKDVWRNDVMHSRKNYNEHEAISVLNYVREFMQRLAKRVTD